MALYQTHAILLAARDYSDADRMVTLFSTEYGKLNAVAYGARSARSRLAGAVQPFAHVELGLQAGKHLDTIKQCEIITSFREIREDLTVMAYASLLAEIVMEFWPEREPQPEVFELLLAAFQLISARNPRIVALATAWHLMQLAGFEPVLERCAVCGGEVAFPAVFSSQAGGIVCSRCHKTGQTEFSAAHKTFLEQLLGLNWENPGHFKVNSLVLAQTEKCLHEFLAYRMEKPLKSLAFIRSIG